MLHAVDVVVVKHDGVGRLPFRFGLPPPALRRANNRFGLRFNWRGWGASVRAMSAPSSRQRPCEQTKLSALMSVIAQYTPRKQEGQTFARLESNFMRVAHCFHFIVRRLPGVLALHILDE